MDLKNENVALRQDKYDLCRKNTDLFRNIEHLHRSTQRTSKKKKVRGVKDTKIKFMMFAKQKGDLQETVEDFEMEKQAEKEWKQKH